MLKTPQKQKKKKKKKKTQKIEAARVGTKKMNGYFIKIVIPFHNTNSQTNRAICFLFK
jgi:hypothetical protein